MTDQAPLGDAASLLRGPVARLLAALDRDGEEARIVGGAVRNALLWLDVHEIDVATTAVPDEVLRRVGRPAGSLFRRDSSTAPLPSSSTASRLKSPRSGVTWKRMAGGPK